MEHEVHKQCALLPVLKVVSGILDDTGHLQHFLHPAADTTHFHKAIFASLLIE